MKRNRFQSDICPAIYPCRIHDKQEIRKPHLKCYNFSGRNIENPDSFERIEAFTKDISSKERRDSLRKAKSMAEQQYGSDYLEEKFYDNFFELYYENCKFEVRKVPCKLSLYAKVFVCWLGGRG